MMDLSKVKVDWNRLTVREFAEFQRAPAAVKNQIGLLCKVVTELPNGDDPSDPATYENMGLQDYEALSNHVVEVRQRQDSKSAAGA